MTFNDARSESSIIHVFPFNSDKKRGGVAVHQVLMVITNTNVELVIHLLNVIYDFFSLYQKA